MSETAIASEELPAADNALGAPEWDLGDLYPGPDSPELARDFDAAEAEAKALAAAYRGHVAELDGDALAAAIARYEALQDKLGRILSYASLAHAADVENQVLARFYGNVQERANRIGTEILFFTLEINHIEDEALEAKLVQSERLAHYRPWLRDLRVFRPYQLSDEIETLLHEKYVAGAGAWTRLFDETVASLRFPVEGRDVSLEEATHLLFDRDRARRARAGHALAEVFGRNLRLFTTIFNTLIKDKEIEDRWRGYPDPAMPRHLANRVEPEVVEALVGAVKAAYPDISHRFYRLKARWLGLDRLEFWDRNAPLPDEAERSLSWEEARETVLGAYGRFSPELAEVGRRFFERPWIDARLRPGKASGAFAHPTVPSAHPYLLMSYQGRVRDVMTLAHELGHGVHQVLAGAQGPLMADTPLTLAETASVFGEMLTFQAMLADEEDRRARRAMLAGKAQDMINTVVRQIAFYDFERRLHAERREGELSAERIGEIWLDVQSESLGEFVHLGPGYETFWCYISHFVHVPFYVYAYAFGDCLVNSLYSVYQEGHPRFQEKYLDMLKAGGTKRYDELLAAFGLDARDPKFWARGLEVIGRMIDQLEAETE